jgi:hypothetical protein
VESDLNDLSETEGEARRHTHRRSSSWSGTDAPSLVVRALVKTSQ